MSDTSDWYRDEGLVLTRLKAVGGWPGPIPRIPGYEDFRELRRGGQGIVYAATQRSTRRKVAVKILLEGAWAAQRHRQRFRREIDLIAALEHPNIVRLYDGGLTSQGQPYYVMEFIEGIGLDELISQGLAGVKENRPGQRSSLPHPSFPEAGVRWPLPVRESLELFAKVCEAVGYAHQRGIIHRDLKPSNIRINRRGEPHVLDFGLARPIAGPAVTERSSEMTRAGEFLGSLAWASPEHLEGRPERIDARADVYSLGVLLFQVLTGQFPYPISGFRETVHGIQNVEPRRPGVLRAEVDAEVDTIVLKCLAKDPDRRYQTAGELAQDVRRYLAGEPIEAKRDSVAYVLGKRLRRHRVPVTLGVALLIVTLVSVVAVLRVWASRDPSTPAVRNVDGSHTVEAGQTLRARQLRVGCRADSALTVADGGQIWDIEAFVGYRRGVAAHVTVDGQRSGWTNVGSLYVGGSREGPRGAGTLNLDGNATVRVGGLLKVWDTGTINLANAGIHADTLDLSKGATFKTTDYAMLFVNRLRGFGDHVSFKGHLGIGHHPIGHRGGVGAHTVGHRQVLELTGDLAVGVDAGGRLDIQAGGEVTNSMCRVGWVADSPGIVVVRGADSKWVNRDWLLVGVGGDGEVQALDGARVFANRSTIGQEGRGRVTLAGPGSTLANRGFLVVGDYSEGELAIRDGAAAASAWGAVAYQEGGAGRVTVDGEGSTWANDGWLEVGRRGPGKLRLRDGGAATNTFGYVGVNAGCTGDVLVNGRGSFWANRASVYLGGECGLPGGVGQLTIENGGAVTIDHTLKIWSRGTVALTDGTLSVDVVDHTAGGTFGFSGGRLCVNTLRGDLVNRGGTLTPAGLCGLLVVTGNYRQDGGTLEATIRRTDSGEHDRFNVAGTATLAGKLLVRFVGDVAPRFEDRCVILTAAEIRGTFDNAEPSLQVARSGSCEVVCTGTQVILTHFAGPFERDALPTGRLPGIRLPKGPFPRVLSLNTTGEHDGAFIGPPDNVVIGIGGRIVEYDFRSQRVVDGPGPDFNVYEAAHGDLEFHLMDVLVSADGVAYITVKVSEGTVVRIPGDEVHGDDNFARSYDLASVGLGSVRFIRIDGLGDGPASRYSGFDLDAVGAIHLTDAEDPPTTRPVTPAGGRGSAAE